MGVTVMATTVLAVFNNALLNVDWVKPINIDHQLLRLSNTI